MARITWAGAARPQRRDGGTVYYSSVYSPFQRQGVVPVRTGSFTSAHPTAALSYLAYVWTSIFTDLQRSDWSTAAPSGVSGYAYFLQLALPIAAFTDGWPPLPYTPADISGNALVSPYTDSSTGRLLCGWFGDFPTDPPLPLYVNIALQVSDLFQFQVSGYANSADRFRRAASGFAAFGSIGPLVKDTWVVADITDAIMAVFGQTPTTSYYPPGTEWGISSYFNCMCYYADSSFQLTSLAKLLPFPAAEPWGLDPLSAVRLAHAPRVGFTPSRRTAHLMALRASGARR